MTTDLQEMKAVRESRREEVLRRLRRLDDITVERAPDPEDEIELVMERESAITLLERDTQLLREMTSRSGGLQMATSAHAPFAEDTSVFGVCGRCRGLHTALPARTRGGRTGRERGKHLRYSWPSHEVTQPNTHTSL